jgi:nucleosome binding factor SPN SPT16 subunit
VTLQTHLLGYEFPDTVLLLVRDASGTRLIEIGRAHV